MKKTTIQIIMITSIIGLMTGCNTDKVETKPVAKTTYAVATPQYKSVSLANISTNVQVKKVNNQKDLREVVELAIALSDNGKHKESAAVFVQASKDFTSPSSKLKEDLISAAVCEYFKAGMIAQVRENLAVLDTFKTSPYNNFDDNNNISKIRKLLSEAK